MRTDIDHKKHARLRAELVEKRSTIEGLSQRHRDSRDEESRLVMMFAVSRHAQVHWRPGDDPAVFLTLTPAQQAECRHEVDQARRIADERDVGAALMQRINELRPAVDALQALVRACDQYVLEA